MVQHSRSSGGSDTAFDFSNPSAVMLILKSLREHTELDTAVRNQIRDLIFSYTNGNRDEATRQTVETRLLAVGITPDSIAKTSNPTPVATDEKKEPPKAGFSTGRVAPSFAGSFAPSLEAQKSGQNQGSPREENVDTVPTEVETVQSVAPAVLEQSTPLPSSTPTPPAPSIPKIVPTIPSQAVPPADVNDAVNSTNDNTKPTPTPTPTPTEPVPEVSAPIPAEVEKSNSIDTTQLLERIRIIKADINTKAGNPVNLVSMNNTIGREYMSALLEAMKQLGSGNSSTIESAMKRLEIAYEQALSVIEMSSVPAVTATQAKQSVPAQQPISSTTPTPAPSEFAKPSVSVPQPPPSPPPAPRQSIPVIERPVAAQSKTVQSEAPTLDNPPLGVTKASSRTRLAAPDPQPQTQVSPVPTPPVAQKPATPVLMSASPAEVVHESEAPSTVPIHSSRMAPAKSVAMATPLRRVEELPTLAEVKSRSESGNPLYTGEITDGLEQLLSEWVIFKKSGIFGTGPRGSEHPLFKKLAPLKIPLIIAGRFEGATEEVRQSITDYMNGWRYEQGIVYEKDETFENYLRRVVRHILNMK